MSELTPEQRVVNWVRIALGKDPLYVTGFGIAATREDSGHYLSLESLRQHADPQCACCGGSGYYDGWTLDERCACTGLPPKGKRGSGRHAVKLRRYPLRLGARP